MKTDSVCFIESDIGKQSWNKYHLHTAVQKDGSSQLEQGPLLDFLLEFKAPGTKVTPLRVGNSSGGNHIGISY
jgi:hypothetical protein